MPSRPLSADTSAVVKVLDFEAINLVKHRTQDAGRGGAAATYMASGT